ncbi:substrate-binding domain-containing protein [Actinomadura algeriensis]|uniref:Simple sugar transport system substrate-binding protein n=1 Tax=Actinomadura algeriensis TaxID=1679523 RepID=A0ABR9JI32_9ACTN|nr:substrate-binding domain-containing protein [Actinomadura algeriensis]MBE1530222.1 simple sugar transport system substrate-binding protein [Actinomadura algeriensis]
MNHAKRRRRAVLVPALLAALVLAVTAACDRVGENGRIGVVYLNAEGYYAGVERGLGGVLGHGADQPQLVQTNIQSDPAKESSFVNTMSSAKVDALVVSPASATASVPALRLAHESGVPVICYNTCVEDAAAREYVDAFVLGDPAEFGRVSGEQMAAHFRAADIANPKVAVINCEQFEVCIQRRQGFEKALTAAVPGAQIVANQQGLTMDEAVERGEQLLTAHPDIDAFYGEAGSQMLGAVRAVEARGKAGQVAVFGGDMSVDAAGKLQDGRVLKGVADISGIKVGRLAGEAVRNVLAGNPPEDFIIPAPIDRYLGPKDGARWMQEHPDGIP